MMRKPRCGEEDTATGSVQYNTTGAMQRLSPECTPTDFVPFTGFPRWNRYLLTPLAEGH
jgi:hypothetical protein